MSDFINNPSKEELMENLELACIIEEYKAKGYNVYIQGGNVSYKLGDEIVHLGTLPNLADTTTYLFGNNVPSDVEYITLDGITLMTYQGAVIACGYLDTSGVKQGAYSINDVINSDLVGAAGGFVDEITGMPIYEGVSTGAAVVEGVLRIDGNTLDYDNVIGLLANFMNFADDHLMMTW